MVGMDGDHGTVLCTFLVVAQKFPGSTHGKDDAGIPAYTLLVLQYDVDYNSRADIHLTVPSSRMVAGVL